jgi:uncharacterized protein (DUF2336 family)
MTAQSLIKELTGFPDFGRRAQVLARVTDLFMSGRTLYDEEQIELFDDVLICLSEQVESPARAFLSERLSMVPNSPRGITRRLAQDSEIRVARPVLLNSEQLDDGTLSEIAKSRTQDHLWAISQRKSISEPVTEILTERGSIDVLHCVVENTGARFFDRTFSKLVQRCAHDSNLAAKAWCRQFQAIDW